MKVINVKIVPDDVHRDAKSAAAQAGVPLQTWVIEAIKMRLEAEKKSK